MGLLNSKLGIINIIPVSQGQKELIATPGYELVETWVKLTTSGKFKFLKLSATFRNLPK